MPIPKQTLIAIKTNHLDTEALETATAAGELEVTGDADAEVSAEIVAGKDDYSEDLGANNINTEAIIRMVSYIPDMFEYLTGTPMLCEVVSLMRGGRHWQKI